MTLNRDENIDRLIVQVLRNGRTPLPELTPARIEFEKRRLLANLSEREHKTVYPRRLVWIAAAGVAMVMIGLISIGVRTFNEGSAPNEIRLAGQWQLSKNDTIAHGAPVVISPGNKAELTLPDGTIVFADQNSRFAVENQSASRIRLDRGRLLISVIPRKGRSGFSVVTPEGEVHVKGTVFSVDAGSGSTTVRLHKGAVSFACKSDVMDLTAGHKVVATAGGFRAMQPLTHQELAADLAIGDSAVRNLVMVAKAPQVSVAAPMLPLRPEIESLDGHGELKLADEKEKGKASGISTKSKVSSLTALWKARDFKGIVAATEKGDLDADALYYRAGALASLGDWRRAAESYRAASGLSSVRRSEMSYRAAGAYSRLGDFKSALQMSDMAISSGGPTADHAWRLKMGALTAMQNYQQAASAATEYLAAYPAGAHVAEANYVKGTGMRLLRKWSAAAQAYQVFLHRSTGKNAMSDDASFYQAFCLSQAGDLVNGKRLMAKYLADYPDGRHVKQVRISLGQ